VILIQYLSRISKLMAGGTEPNYVLVVLGHEAWTITENLILGKNPEVEFININL
jgi:hypothetical protein